MTRRQVSVRLNETELAQVDVLVKGRSREQWFRDVIADEAKRQIKENELKIATFESALVGDLGDDFVSLLRVQKLQELAGELQFENLALDSTRREE